MADSAADAPAVLFDLDGTLVDTVFHHAVAWHRALLDVGQEVPCWRIQGLVGRSGDELVSILIGEDLAEKHGDEAKERHSRYFAEFESTLRATPGVRGLLEKLADEGWRTVLASSAGEKTLKLLRRVLDVDDLLSEVTSSADADQAKPDPDIVNTALERVGRDEKRAIFVGDAVWDMEAGKRAGVPTVAVLCGGVAREALEQAGAAAVYDDPQEILDHFEEFTEFLRS